MSKKNRASDEETGLFPSSSEEDAVSDKDEMSHLLSSDSDAEDSGTSLSSFDRIEHGDETYVSTVDCKWPLLPFGLTATGVLCWTFAAALNSTFTDPTTLVLLGGGTLAILLAICAFIYDIIAGCKDEPMADSTSRFRAGFGCNA
jgi:hypothetical protein